MAGTRPWKEPPIAVRLTDDEILDNILDLHKKAKDEDKSKVSKYINFVVKENIILKDEYYQNLVINYLK